MFAGKTRIMSAGRIEDLRPAQSIQLVTLQNLTRPPGCAQILLRVFLFGFVFVPFLFSCMIHQFDISQQFTQA